jgi:hypothetical protein
MRKISGFWIVALALLNAGCGTFRLSTGASSTSAPTTALFAAPPSPTQVPLPTSTLPPSATPAGTSTSFPATSTLIPTLTAREREAYVLELLKTNAGCVLPCWWGIVPGATTWATARQFIAQMGARSNDVSLPTGRVGHGTGGFDLEDKGAVLRVEFVERAGLVESTRIHSEGYLDPLAFQSVWEHYFPRQIMLRYGQPSRVWVETASRLGDSQGEVAAYSLWLFYDKLGFLIRTSGRFMYDAIYRICPEVQTESEGMNGIDIYLQSADNRTPLEEASGMPAGEEMEYIRPIEQAAGLTVDDFYKLIVDSNEPTCFETPRDIWPR